MLLDFDVGGQGPAEVRHPRIIKKRLEPSADGDFDKIICEYRKIHLLTLPPDFAQTKACKSHFWTNWLKGAVLDIDGDNEILNWVPETDFSDEENEDDQVNDSKESIVGSPPVADDDRRFGPSVQDQHQQGGPEES